MTPPTTAPAAPPIAAPFWVLDIEAQSMQKRIKPAIKTKVKALRILFAPFSHVSSLVKYISNLQLSA
jgi:hypothetical protein